MSLGNKTLEDLLAPISARLGRTSVPEQIEPAQIKSVPKRPGDGKSQAELVEMFADEAAKVRVTVHRCTRDGLADEVAALVAAEGEGGVVVANDERLFGIAAALELEPAATSVKVWSSADAQECVDAAVAARYGIAYAESGIAETATVVQPTGPDCGRSITLTPLCHIAIVDASTIVSTMADALEGYGAGKMPAQLCFISGPSATADIELVRVEGVHGPMYVHYVIVE